MLSISYFNLILFPSFLIFNLFSVWFRSYFSSAVRAISSYFSSSDICDRHVASFCSKYLFVCLRLPGGLSLVFIGPRGNWVKNRKREEEEEGGEERWNSSPQYFSPKNAWFDNESSPLFSVLGFFFSILFWRNNSSNWKGRRSRKRTGVKVICAFVRADNELLLILLLTPNTPSRAAVSCHWFFCWHSFFVIIFHLYTA